MHLQCCKQSAGNQILVTVERSFCICSQCQETSNYTIPPSLTFSLLSYDTHFLSQPTATLNFLCKSTVTLNFLCQSAVTLNFLCQSTVTLNFLWISIRNSTWLCGWLGLHLEPGRLLVQEPQVAHPDQEVEKAKDLGREIQYVQNRMTYNLGD